MEAVANRHSVQPGLLASVRVMLHILEFTSAERAVRERNGELAAQTLADSVADLRREYAAAWETL